MVKRFRKFESGEGSQFITRKAALRKLQLSLKDFRTLCIIKGIYPREPKHRRRAQKGKTGIQTLYLKKDIQFLMHEPIIWKIREMKVHMRKIKRAKSLKEYGLVKRYARTIPIIDIDHIVRERYPTFVDALRDLDDCLTLCFLFATLPNMKSIPPHMIALCRRLTVEFMHIIIACQALRYVFVSIKGIYFQVELQGQTITWIIPHSFAYEPHTTKEVDFRTMATFTEFYTTVLGFVNYRLYYAQNLKYPPVLKGYSTADLELEKIDDRIALSDRIAALNVPLERSGASVETVQDIPDLDEFPTMDDAEAADKAREEYEKIRALKTLFAGLRVFLNREVPREPMVFVLRCFGAQVSWDPTVFPGLNLFSEDDETITHQIVDRPAMDKQYISRYYVQPQWVFDCVNARKLVPVEKYFMGMTLPPHLSPFSQGHRTQRYVPPEERAMLDPNAADDYENTSMIDNEDLSSKVEDSEESGNENTLEEGVEMENEKTKDMKVTAGEVFKPDKRKIRKDYRQAFALREKMIKKKYQALYKSMKEGRLSRQKEIKLLKYKRRLVERKKLEAKKAEMRAQRMSDALQG